MLKTTKAGKYDSLTMMETPFNPYGHRPENRVAVLMDVRNVTAVLRKRGIGPDFDFKKLLIDVIDGRRCVAAVAVDSNYHDDEDAGTGFQCYLKKCGFRLDIVSATNSEGKQEGTDIRLALIAYRMALEDVCDTVVLITGDGDFTVLVKALQNEMKVVEVLSFEEALSNRLRKQADLVELIDSMPMIRLRSASPVEGGSE